MSGIDRYFEVVHSILSRDIQARDHDSVLLYRIIELAGLDPKTMTLAEWCRMWYRNSTPSPETIARVRRKVQEEFPETRGAGYDARTKQEIETVTDLIIRGQKATENMKKTLNVLQEELKLEKIP